MITTMVLCYSILDWLRQGVNTRGALLSNSGQEPIAIFPLFISLRLVVLRSIS